MNLHRFSALALASTALFAVTASAGTRSYSHAQNAVPSQGIHIQSPGEGVTNRSIVLPLNKSSVIELPENVMDVIVSNPDIVEAVVHTSKRTVLIGKTAGQTNAYFYGHDGRELLNIDIRVETDINGLSELIRKNVPESSVTVQAINSRILLTGSVPNASAAAKVEALAALWAEGSTANNDSIVNLLAIEGKDQVMLKVRIVEMQRSVTKQLGFDLNAVAQLGDSTVSLVNSSAVAAGSGFTGNFDFLNSDNGTLRSLSGALAALENVGLVRTLAEPTLTAISGETANFLAGGEIPLLSGGNTDQSGNLIRTFEFKPFGVSLGFTPVVLSEGRINLNISTEVSEPSLDNAFVSEAGTILGLRVRRANTVVELPAGGSLVIAGLIREEARNSVQGLPGAKDIPGIGALFRGRDDLTTQTEIVVIVTPYLVDPTHPDKLQTPLDGFSESNDYQSILHGRINEVYDENKVKNLSDAGYGGAFGHVVD